MCGSGHTLTDLAGALSGVPVRRTLPELCLSCVGNQPHTHAGINFAQPLYGQCAAVGYPKQQCSVVTGYNFVGNGYIGTREGPAAVAGAPPVSTEWGGRCCKCQQQVLLLAVSIHTMLPHPVCLSVCRRPGAAHHRRTAWVTAAWWRPWRARHTAWRRVSCWGRTACLAAPATRATMCWWRPLTARCATGATSSTSRWPQGLGMRTTTCTSA